MIAYYMQPVTADGLDFSTREQIVYDYPRQAITERRWGPDDPIVGSRVAGDLG